MRPLETQLSRRGEEGFVSPSVWRRALAASVGASLVLGAIAGLAFRQDARHAEALSRREGSYLVALEREFLARELRAVRSDLVFLAQQPLLARAVSGEGGARAALEREYAGFARSKPLYDQVRLLDEGGQEVVRVNRRDGDVEVVEAADLQSKAARYYFREAIALAPGEIFVSPLDLNVERGQIERPLKPVIRLATPVTGRSRERRGVLVLNYAGVRLLGKLREIAAGSRGDVMLVNREGQYLQAPDARREWGWLLGHGASFARDYPRVWEQLREAELSQIRIGTDLFTMERVSFSESDVAREGVALMISRIPLGEALGWPAVARRAPLLGAAFVAIGVLSLYWARASARRQLQDRRIAESEARLRVLSSRLLAAQEEERRSLSRLLHDELGQRVTAVALDLKAALRHGAGQAEPVLRRTIEETESVLAGLHEIATRVRPSVLDDLGLGDAIESYVADYQERTGVSVALDLRLPERGIPGPVAENLYRILQEGLANLAEHAGTDAAEVRLVGAPDGLELTIEDAGCGFDPATLAGTRRLGILGMRERVELLGGAFELETAVGQGTKIRVGLPLGRAGPADAADAGEGGG